jgi:1,4-dihydroxy-2-naphthoate octaprenyltransferase
VKSFVIIYLVLTVVFLIDVILSITVLEFVRQAVSVRERPKLVTKINELKEMRKYVIIWPYILFRLIRDNVNQ